MTEAEFLDIAMSHQVSPYVHDPNTITPGRPLPDQESWDRS